MVVRLKSGGPPTVVRFVSGDQAYCEWFTDTERRQGSFGVETIEPVEAPLSPASASHAP